jgi:hypothetical protein
MSNSPQNSPAKAGQEESDKFARAHLHSEPAGPPAQWRAIATAQRVCLKYFMTIL